MTILCVYKYVILNPKEYQYKFDAAMAYSLSNEHGKALNLLLELKEKRWINFELFKMIAEQYMALGQYNQAQMIMKQINPLDAKQKEELLKLEQLMAFQKEDKNQSQQPQQEPKKEDLDEEIFKETNELCLQKQELQLMYQRKVKNLDLQVLLNFGYFQTLKLFIQRIYDLDYSRLETTEDRSTIISCLIIFENYQLALNLIETVQEDYLVLWMKDAFCYEKLKQYNLSLNTMRKSILLNNNEIARFKSEYLHYLLCLQNQTIYSKLVYYIKINYVVYNQMAKKFEILTPKRKSYQIQNLKTTIKQSNNCCLYLYSELFSIEYKISKNNPNLQRICYFLRKYSPLYSAGYAHQYQLFMDQKLINNALALEQSLKKCEDCSLKYILLAKLYKFRRSFTLAHQALDEAKQINEFNEEIYQIENNNLSYSIKLTCLETKKFQLEKENYNFVCQTIAPMIEKYDYHRVIDLLQLVDKDSQKFDELKLLFKIVSYKTEQDFQQILKSIESLDYTASKLFFGHYYLSKNHVRKAYQFYQQIDLNFISEKDKIHYQQQMKIVDSIKQIESLKQHEITDIICQMGIINYIPSQDKSIIIHQRYINIIGFVLTSIVYNQNQEENVEIINSKYDMEVPKIDGFKLTLIQIIEGIYRQNTITTEKYQSFIEKGLLQLQTLFTSTDIFMNSLYEFSDKYKKEMIKQFNQLDHEVVQLEKGIQNIYLIPFFADPISRYALVSVIKMIGYFIEFELVNNYQRMEERLINYLTKQNIEAYYKQIMKDKRTY